MHKKIFTLVFDNKDNLYFTTDESKFFSIRKIIPNSILSPNQYIFNKENKEYVLNEHIFNKENKEYVLNEYGFNEYGFNQVFYALTVDSQDNIYFGNYVYWSSKNELMAVGLVDKTVLSIAVDKYDNVYYSTLLGGLSFLQKGEKQVKKTNVFGEIAHTIAVEHNDNIFIKNNDGPFMFQVYHSPVIPSLKKRGILVVEILGYVFLSCLGALGLSCLATWGWNKYRYKKRTKLK